MRLNKFILLLIVSILITTNLALAQSPADTSICPSGSKPIPQDISESSINELVQKGWIKVLFAENGTRCAELIFPTNIPKSTHSEQEANSGRPVDPFSREN